MTAIPGESSRASSHDASIEFRDWLFANNWSDDNQLAGRMEAQPGVDAKHALTEMRRGGMLLGVWSTLRRCFLYPDFQFDRTGRLIREVSLLQAILPAAGDDGGWRRAFWLYSPHSLLDGSTPSEIFAADPLQLIEVAKAEFEAPPHSGW